MSCAGYLRVLTVFGGMLMARWCAAQPVVWNGRAGDDNWSTDFNWDDGVAPANDGTADVVFAGSVGPRPYVDANWSVDSLGFDGLAGAFTISGFPLSVGSGGIINNSERPQTINTPIDLRSGQTWDAAGARLSFGGAINNGMNTLTVSGGANTTIHSTINNGGGLIKRGAGTLALGGGAGDTSANSYSGVTEVHEGILTLDKAAGTVAIAGDLRVAYLGGTVGGTVNATRSGQISSTSNVILEGGAINFGDSNTIGSFTGRFMASYSATADTLNLTSTARYALTLDGYGNYSGQPGIFNLTGAFGGGISEPLASLHNSTLRGIGLGGVTREIHVAAPAGNYDLGVFGLVSGAGGIYKTGGGTLALIPEFYGGGGNTYTGGTTVNDGTIHISSDGGLGPAGTPLVLNAGVLYPASLMTSASFSLTHPVTSNGGEFRVREGTALTVLTPVEGGSFSKIGEGTLVLTANTSTESITIKNGTLMLAGTATPHLKELNIAGSTIFGVGVLDMRENSLVLEGGDLQVITDQIRSGLSERTGIVSSARGDPYRLGSMINNDNRPGRAIYQSFQGVGRLDGDEVLIRYTFIGDLNLDGTVSIADFIDLAAHFNTIGGATWQVGDVNYDGSVTISDFIDLASNFGQSLGGITTPISEEDWGMLSSFAASAGVPEPALFGLIAAAPLGLIRRRHKMSCM